MRLVIKIRDLLVRTGCLQSAGFDNFPSEVIHFALKTIKILTRLLRGHGFQLYCATFQNVCCSVRTLHLVYLELIILDNQMISTGHSKVVYICMFRALENILQS